MRPLAVLIAVLAVVTVPPTVDAKQRRGTPKPSVVLRAIAGVAKATPFASGRAAARGARRAFARKQFCPASSALARHHTQVVKRLKVAKKRKARGAVRRLTALDGRSVKARALVLRSLPVGKACGGPPAVAVDRSIKPRGRLPAIGGSGPRPVARVVDAYGHAVDFAANELIVRGSDAEVRALVRRWNGKILATADMTKIGARGKQFLIRIDVARADETRLSADLAALTRARGGAATVSSEAGLDLLAAAGREARGGATVGVNFVSRGSAIAGGISREASQGPDGFATTGPGWDSDAFHWKHMSATSTQGVGTAQAWQLLARSGRSANRVGLAVLDMGFATVTNGPDFGAPLTAISNVPATSALGTENILGCGSSPCLWHGTNVANTAFAVPDNNLGVAGTGGLVANRIVVFTLYDFFTSITAVIAARAAGARVLNMSYGAPVPAILSWSVLPFEITTVALHATGLTLMAAAGNDSTNVDDEDCFIVCWEETWWTPCENRGVLCVGALGHDSVSRASYSNWGRRNGGVDLFAPGTVLMGIDPATRIRPGESGVHSEQGTSFASPYLAGVAALVWAANPGLSNIDVERILADTAKTSTDGNVRRYVDALAAVKRALPPLIKIETPVEGSSLAKGASIPFSAFAYDDDLGAPSITWTRSDGTVIGTGASFSTTSLPYGAATVTARAVFPGGAAVTDQVHLTITNTPPTIAIQQPANGSSFYQNEQVPLSGESADANQPESGYHLRDEQVTWYRDGSATPFATGHNVTLNLTGVSVGMHTITMRGTDDAGVSATESIVVNVATAPANPPPTVSITTPANPSSQVACCQEPPPDNRYYAVFNFQANASDPNGDPLTYTWTDAVVPGGTPQTRSTVQDPGNQRVHSTTGCTQAHDWRLSVSDGTSTRSAIVRVTVQVPC